MSSKLRKSHWLKTCPSCSIREGSLVFKQYPKAFGKSKKRPGEGAQSWCSSCRKEAARVK